LEGEGEDYALDIFLDGAGYFLTAQAWVPFFPSHRAFILYLCWDQANLRHNDVSLEKLEDKEAIVRFDRIHYFELYAKSGHMKHQIPLDEYIKIFETIWQDRAKNAGWNLEIESKGKQITFYFTR
jgi:hypothetical protein